MAVQDAEADALAGGARESLKMRQRLQADRAGVEQRSRQHQHRVAGRDAAVARILREVALSDQRLDQAMRRRPRDAGAHRDLRHRQRALRRGEGVQDRERLP